MPVPAEDGAIRYASRIANTLNDTHTRVIVAEEDGEVVGYVMGVIVDLLPEVFEAERSGFVADIFVLAEARGQGTGRALIEAMKRWFRGRGIHHFEWYVASSNKDGIAFWRAVNGEEVMLRMRANIEEQG
jgi:ribosomal protein S18 acetylase RimI-like enzyme